MVTSMRREIGVAYPSCDNRLFCYWALPIGSCGRPRTNGILGLHSLALHVLITKKKVYAIVFWQDNRYVREVA